MNLVKLAEALILRADYQKRVEQLRQRLLRNARVQEGDEPPEEPRALLAELEDLSNRLTILIQRINHTNSASTIEVDGRPMTLTNALAVRDTLRLRQSVYRDLANSASANQTRYSNSEIKFRSTVDVAEVQARADDLARQYRELDTKIQESNWLVTLVE